MMLMALLINYVFIRLKQSSSSKGIPAVCEDQLYSPWPHHGSALQMRDGGGGGGVFAAGAGRGGECSRMCPRVPPPRPAPSIGYACCGSLCSHETCRAGVCFRSGQKKGSLSKLRRGCSVLPSRKQCPRSLYPRRPATAPAEGPGR